MASDRTPTVTVALTSAQPSGTTAIAETPRHVPDVIVVYLSPVLAIAVRAAKTYLNSLIGFLGAGVTGIAPATLPADHFWVLLATAASLAIAPAVVSVLMSTSMLLSKLDQKFPTLQA